MSGLKFICFIRELEYKDIALKIGVSKQTISDWVKGRSNIKDKYVLLLEKELGVSGHYLTKELSKEEMIGLIEFAIEWNSNLIGGDWHEIIR